MGKDVRMEGARCLAEPWKWIGRPRAGPTALCVRALLMTRCFSHSSGEGNPCSILCHVISGAWHQGVPGPCSSMSPSSEWSSVKVEARLACLLAFCCSATSCRRPMYMSAMSWSSSNMSSNSCSILQHSSHMHPSRISLHVDRLQRAL